MPTPPLPILYADNHLLAIDKPAGLPTQAGVTHDGHDAESLMRAWVKAECGKPGEAFLHAVHRLDREVSGIVLLARTSKALSRLNQAMRNRQVVKLYRAVVLRSPQPASGRRVDWLVHGDRQAEVVPAGTAGALEAILDYRLLGGEAGRFWLEVRLETGRYHQIRAQLAAAGWPIAGDVRYGGCALRSTGILLHHCQMEFPHPVRPDPVTITCEPPPGWATAR